MFYIQYIYCRFSGAYTAMESKSGLRVLFVAAVLLVLCCSSLVSVVSAVDYASVEWVDPWWGRDYDRSVNVDFTVRVLNTTSATKVIDLHEQCGWTGPGAADMNNIYDLTVAPADLIGQTDGHTNRTEYWVCGRIAAFEDINSNGNVDISDGGGWSGIGNWASATLYSYHKPDDWEDETCEDYPYNCWYYSTWRPMCFDVTSYIKSNGADDYSVRWLHTGGANALRINDTWLERRMPISGYQVTFSQMDQYDSSWNTIGTDTTDGTGYASISWNTPNTHDGNPIKDRGYDIKAEIVGYTTDGRVWTPRSGEDVVISKIFVVEDDDWEVKAWGPMWGAEDRDWAEVSIDGRIIRVGALSRTWDMDGTTMHARGKDKYLTGGESMVTEGGRYVDFLLVAPHTSTTGTLEVPQLWGFMGLVLDEDHAILLGAAPYLGGLGDLPSIVEVNTFFASTKSKPGYDNEDLSEWTGLSIDMLKEMASAAADRGENYSKMYPPPIAPGNIVDFTIQVLEMIKAFFEYIRGVASMGQMLRGCALTETLALEPSYQSGLRQAGYIVRDLSLIFGYATHEHRAATEDGMDELTENLPEILGDPPATYGLTYVLKYFSYTPPGLRQEIIEYYWERGANSMLLTRDIIREWGNVFSMTGEGPMTMYWWSNIAINMTTGILDIVNILLESAAESDRLDDIAKNTWGFLYWVKIALGSVFEATPEECRKDFADMWGQCCNEDNGFSVDCHPGDDYSCTRENIWCFEEILGKSEDRGGVGQERALNYIVRGIYLKTTAENWRLLAYQTWKLVQNIVPVLASAMQHVPEVMPTHGYKPIPVDHWIVDQMDVIEVMDMTERIVKVILEQEDSHKQASAENTLELVYHVIGILRGIGQYTDWQDITNTTDEVAENIHLILGPPNASSGYNYLFKAVPDVPDSIQQKFRGELFGYIGTLSHALANLSLYIDDTFPPP